MSSNPPIRTVEQVLATGYRIDTFSVLSRSWELVKTGLAPLVVFSIAALFMSFFLGGVFARNPFAVSLLSFVLSPIIMGALMVGIRRLMLGQTLELADFKDVQPLLIPLIVVGVISGLLGSLGFVLCILPGLYAIIVLGFAMPLVIDRGTDPLQAIKDSVAISNKSLLDLTILIAVMGLIGIAGALACGVGLVVALPLVATMRMVAYADIMGLAEPPLGGMDRAPVPSDGGDTPVPPSPGFAPPPSATPAVPAIAPTVDPVNPFGDDDDQTTPRPPVDLPQ